MKTEDIDRIAREVSWEFFHEEPSANNKVSVSVRGLVILVTSIIQKVNKINNEHI